jgi:hypothetical protein
MKFINLTVFCIILTFVSFSFSRQPAQPAGLAKQSLNVCLSFINEDRYVGNREGLKPIDGSHFFKSNDDGTKTLVMPNGIVYINAASDGCQIRKDKDVSTAIEEAFRNGYDFYMNNPSIIDAERSHIQSSLAALDTCILGTPTGVMKEELINLRRGFKNLLLPRSNSINKADKTTN